MKARLTVLWVAAILLAPLPGGRASEAAVVRVGSEVEFPPYAFVDKDGRAAGFSVDLIRAVAETMNLQIEFTTGTWDSVWGRLVAGQLDVLPIVAKLPDHARLVDFSLPHTETYDAFFVRPGSPAFATIEAARGKEIVVMRSDAAHHFLVERKFQGRLILVDTIPAGLALVASGRHDAFLCSKLIGSLTLQKHKGQRLVAGPPIPDYKRIFSFAVRKGSPELVEKLNEGLMLIKASGEYERIYDRWLSMEDPWNEWKRYLAPAVLVLLAGLLASAIWVGTLRRMVQRATRELAEKNERLRQIQDGLETAVAERTADLELANAKLQSEVGERKLAEAEVRSSREKFQRYFQMGAIGHCVTSVEKGWMEVNDRLCEMLGYSKQELFQFSWSQLTHPDDLAADIALFNDMLAGKRDVYELDKRFICKDGSILYTRLNVACHRNADGTVDYFLASLLDITERRRAEEARARLSAIVESSEDAIIGKDLDGLITSWNGGAEELFGYSAPEIVGTSIRRLIPADHQPEEDQILAKIQMGESVQHFETVRQTRDGRLVNVSVSVSPIKDTTGKIIGVSKVARDITERKKAEAQRERLEAQNRQLQKRESLGRMAGAVAHHFNNQLTVVLGNLELANVDLPRNTIAADCLAGATRAAQKAAEMSGLMLTYLGKTFGKHELLNLAELCGSYLPVLQGSIPGTMRLETFLPAPGPVIKANAVQMQQVVTNLLTNAWEACGQERGDIRLAVRTVSAKDIPVTNRFPLDFHPKDLPYACLEVADTGCGISPGDIEKVFDPFYSSKFVGRGLGLAVVMGITGEHGGCVTVESKPGCGSVFRVYVPVTAEVA